MAACAARRRTCAIAVTAGVLAGAATLLSWDSASLARSRSAGPAASFAERFHVASMASAGTSWSGPVLALQAPGSPLRDPYEPEMQTISPDSPDDIWSPYRLAVKPYRPQPPKSSPGTRTAQPAAPRPTPAELLPPDFGDLAVPAAVVSVTTLAMAELAAKDYAAAQSSRTGGSTLRPAPAPAAAANPVTLPGPFHVFFTTGPADGVLTVGAADPAAASSGATGLAGNVTGLVGSTVGSVGSTVSGVVSTAGSTVGSVVSAVKR